MIPILSFAALTAEATPKGKQKPALKNAFVVPAPEGHYDEVFEQDPYDKNRFVVRPQYRDIVAHIANFGEPRMASIARGSRRDFLRKTTISVLPRVILDSEYDLVLKPAVDQRGRAVRAFLQDFHMNNGRPRISKAGIMPQSVVDAIVSRHSERGYVGSVPPQVISLIYGPDMMRAADGEFYFVEDNQGFLGGRSDLQRGLNSLYRNVPEYQNSLHEREPKEFYRTLVQRFRARAVPSTGKIVFVGDPLADDISFNELAEIYKEFGVEAVTPSTTAKLEFDAQGVWFRKESSARRQRVGFLIINGEFFSLEPDNFALRRKRLMSYGERYLPAVFRALFRRYGDETPPLQEIESVLRMHGEGAVLRRDGFELAFDGMVAAILSGRVGSDVTPGTEFTNDKEFYAYGEKIIEFYLKEKPLVRNIESLDPRVRLPDGEWGGLNEALFNEVRDHQQEFVIKVVDGRGGRGVSVGAKVGREEFAEALQEVRAWPGRYQYVRYKAFSAIGNQIADVRIFADVPPTGSVFVGDTPWSRGASPEGNGLVNRAAGGRDVVVTVRSSGKFCATLFETLAPSSVYYRRAP